ncbi:FkbM family methyltransferase [Candidatus Pelagibacter sp.]|nr:FkbM family methyltransferase [Candidatus Pelagibacter sp.]
MRLRVYLVQKILVFFDYFQQKKIFNFLQKKIKKKSIFFDVGAHHGETIQNILKYFKVQQIHAFEASHKNFSTLKRKIFQNDPLVRLNCIGLSNKTKSAKINQSIESSSTTLSFINKKSKYYKKKLRALGVPKSLEFTKPQIVNLDTLDNYLKKIKFKKKIDLLKIDTEGHELYVLYGAKKNLPKIKLIYFEHHYDDMLSKGYKFSEINDFLIQNHFVKIFKSKMYFRKTFEYIYERKI